MIPLGACLKRVRRWCFLAFFIRGLFFPLSTLAASPTVVPVPLRLAQVGVDAPRGEMWALVENVTARSVAAGVEWRLWTNADPYGQSVVASGALPALEPEATYLLTVAIPKPEGVYRLQLLFRAAHGYTGSVWSEEIPVATLAEPTPTSAPTEAPLALVALPLLAAPDSKPTPTPTQATATLPPTTLVPLLAALPTTEQHRVLMPAIAQPPATTAPTPLASAAPEAPDSLALLAVGALAVLILVGAIAIVRRIAQDEDVAPPSGPDRE